MAIGSGWADGAWVDAGWVTEAWVQAGAPEPPANPGSGGASASGDLITPDAAIGSPAKWVPIGNPVRNYEKA